MTVDQLAESLGVSHKELANILQVGERDLNHINSESELHIRTLERFPLLQNLVAHGLLDFDGKSEALADWMRYPLGELQGHTPLSLISTVSGFGLVDDVLTRIAYGVYS